MAVKILKVDVWSAEIRDEIGGLAAVLGPLAAAGPIWRSLSPGARLTNPARESCS